MPLIPQQEIVVITGPYRSLATSETEAPELLKAVLEDYPPCRIVSITATKHLGDYRLTAVVETI